MQIQCPKCHGWSESDDINICPLCGESLDGKHHDRQNDDLERKKKIFRSKWFWIACVAGLGFVGWIVSQLNSSSELGEIQAYFQSQKQAMQSIQSMRGYYSDNSSFTDYINQINPDCLWYYENFPHPITKETIFSQGYFEPKVIVKHQQNKCTNGKEDKLLRAWHLGEDENHKPICYTDSLHPPKGVHDYEPGQFRLSFELDSNRLGWIESLSEYLPGYPKEENTKYYVYFASDSQQQEYVIGDTERDKDRFNIYAKYIKGGKYLHVVFPVMHPKYSTDENMFFYVYRALSLDGIEICGEWAKSKQWAAKRMGDSP